MLRLQIIYPLGYGKLNRFHLIFSTLLLGSWLSWVQAETVVPQLSDPEIISNNESSQAPTLVDRTRESLGEGLEQIQQKGASALQKSGEYGDELVTRGQQSAEQVWSSTRQTSAEWAGKSVDAANRAGDAVVRATHATIQTGAAAWDSTKEASAELWEKGQQVGDVVKTEIVGTDGAAAPVIDKSAPLGK